MRRVSRKCLRTYQHSYPERCRHFPWLDPGNGSLNCLGSCHRCRKRGYSRHEGLFGLPIRCLQSEGCLVIKGHQWSVRQLLIQLLQVLQLDFETAQLTPVQSTKQTVSVFASADDGFE